MSCGRTESVLLLQNNTPVCAADFKQLEWHFRHVELTAGCGVADREINLLCRVIVLADFALFFSSD